jgi:3-oxoacyl-[acyl-carrier protein] reductase
VVIETDPSLDLGDAHAVSGALRSLVGSGTVDRVVLAAIDPSAFRAAPITSLSEEEWDQAAEYPMRAAFVVLQQVHTVIADGGRVVLILPTVATTGVTDLVPLCSAVEAIRVMAKAVARRWGARSITVNTIEVELAAFMLGDDVEGDAGGVGVPVVPVLGQPALPPGSAVDDVLGLLDMLATPAAAAITGALLVADRGTVMQP